MGAPTASQRTINLNLVVLKVMYIAFIVLIVLKTLVWPPPSKEPNTIIFILQLIPVVAFAFGIFTERRRQIAGFCYVLLIYFVGIGANMFVPGALVYTWFSLFLVVGMYTSGMMHVRWTRDGVDIGA